MLKLISLIIVPFLSNDRYASGDNGDDDTNDVGSSKERFETDGTHPKQQSRNGSA